MTDSERIAEISERESKATKGPWEADKFSHEVEAVIHWPDGKNALVVICKCNDECPHLDVRGGTNQKFIAHARQDVPWLLDKLSTANARIAELEAAMQKANKPIENAECVIDENLCETIYEALKQYRCLYCKVEDGEAAQLLDVLANFGGSLTTGDADIELGEIAAEIAAAIRAMKKGT